MIKWSSAVLALAMAAACASAPDPDPMKQGARLMAQLKTASGGTKLDGLTTYHYSGTHVRDGKVNVTYDAWGDFRTMANTQRETSEGVTVTGGYDGKVGWSVGPDGKVRTSSAPERLKEARMGAYFNTYAYLFPNRFPATFEFRGREEVDGKPYDVVKVAPEGAIPFDLWLDPGTHLVSRLVVSSGAESAVGQFQEYQTVDSVKVFRRGVQTMKMGDQTHTETTAITTFRFEPVPLEKLGPPK
ncbi:MAG TPA: hypothetical protein VGO52_07100 [Hyphomonadaceae bacterium]|jgi:hypothetical protein|nr:hypothetical protein [Hyphomonadaceae bacterium]